VSISLAPFPDADGHDRALALDAEDPLAAERHGFVADEPGLIYLDGNSLGRLPSATRPLVDGVVADQWGNRLIRSWNEGWWDLHSRLGDLLAPAIGARPGEVLLSDSTSVNLHKLAVAALRSQPGRSVVLTDDLNFPSDLYILAGAADLVPGRRVDVVSSADGIHGPVEKLEAALDDDTALVSLSHTCFTSGYTYDLTRLTRAAHDVGALVLFDLSHSVGAVDLDLGAAGVDLAVGCTYKYLNGGPGAPAFLYVREDLQERLESPISGWWAHAEPFDFSPSFTADPGIRRFHGGTMPILSLAAIEPGLDQVVRVGVGAIRAKSVQLMAFLEEQWRTHLEPLGFGWGSPTDPSRRGAHGSLTHPDAWRITRALIDHAAVIPDFRAPDVVRLGLAPLTTSFIDVHTAVQRLCLVIDLGFAEHIAAGGRPSVT
jgi:kynureninase